MKKAVLVIFLIAVVLIGVVACFVLYQGREKNVTGYVYDCFTQQPISNIDVQAQQSGIRYLSEILPIFTFPHSFVTKTDKNGYFDLRFTIGSSANIWFYANGYFDHNVWKGAGEKDTKIYLISDTDIKYKGTMKPWTVEMGDGYINPLPNKVYGCEQDGYFEY